MKKLILIFFLVMSVSFSLEITDIDSLDFGVVVAGDKNVSLTNVGVYIEGNPGKEVEIIIPETYDLKGNSMSIRMRENKIILNGEGRGKFRLDIKLKLNNISGNETLTDNLSIKVKYTDKQKR